MGVVIIWLKMRAGDAFEGVASRSYRLQRPHGTQNQAPPTTVYLQKIQLNFTSKSKLIVVLTGEQEICDDDKRLEALRNGRLGSASCEFSPGAHL